MLEREDILLNQERDVERAWHLRDTQKQFNTPTLSLQIHPLEGHHDHIDIAAGWIETAQCQRAVEVDAEEILLQQTLKLRLQGIDFSFYNF
jgi:hypothetical protein